MKYILFIINFINKLWLRIKTYQSLTTVRSFASTVRPFAENVFLQWSVCKENNCNCNYEIIKYREILLYINQTNINNHKSDRFKKVF